MKKVYFTQINNLIADAIFLPLSVAYIWEYCKTQVTDWELGNIFFEREFVEDYLKKIDNPDILALSTYVWNWDITCQLARAVKKKYPNCKIIMGIINDSASQKKTINKQVHALHKRYKLL